MISKIKRYFKDIFKNRRYEFIIGTMDEKITKDFLNNCCGIGLDTFGAYAHMNEYDPNKLDGKWAVDVLELIKRSYNSHLSQLNEGLENPEFFHRWAFRMLIDSAVLEEVCHTAGYTHKTEEEIAYATEFFSDLVRAPQEPCLL